jgi:hypothetical protein
MRGRTAASAVAYGLKSGRASDGDRLHAPLLQCGSNKGTLVLPDKAACLLDDAGRPLV